MTSAQENGVGSSVGTHKSHAKLKNGYKSGPSHKRSRSLGNVSAMSPVFYISVAFHIGSHFDVFFYLYF